MLHWACRGSSNLRNQLLSDSQYHQHGDYSSNDRLGLDAPVDSFAVAFANAGYVLWHANQAARYNILNGIMPPESGHWKNNPHYDISAINRGINIKWNKDTFRASLVFTIFLFTFQPGLLPVIRILPIPLNKAYKMSFDQA